MRRASTDRVVASSGPEYRHGPVTMEPKPVRGAIPIVVGGHTAAAGSARRPSGWGTIPAAYRGGELRRLVFEARRHAEQIGRDPKSVEASAAAPRDEADADVLVELGITRVIVSTPHVETALLPERLAGHLERVRSSLPVTMAGH